MGSTLRSARQFFEADGWFISPEEDGGFLRIAFAGKKGNWGCLVLASDDPARIIFYSVYPDLVPETAMAAVAEYLSRVNWGMPIGNFELDWLSGEIRFRTSVTVEDASVGASILRPLAYANVYTMDGYFADLGAVIRGELDPETPDVLRSLRSDEG